MRQHVQHKSLGTETPEQNLKVVMLHLCDMSNVCNKKHLLPYCHNKELDNFSFSYFYETVG